MADQEKQFFQGRRAHSEDIQEGFDALYQMMEMLNHSKHPTKTKREQAKRLEKIYKALVRADLDQRRSELISMFFSEIPLKIKGIEAAEIAYNKTMQFRASDFNKAIDRIVGGES